MPTIAQIAHELGKSKGTVRNKIKEYGLESHVSVSGDGRATRVVDDYAASVLAAKLGGKVPANNDRGETAPDGSGSALIDALNAHIADLQKAVDERGAEIERREREHAVAMEAKDAEIADLRRRLDAALEAERRASGAVQRIAGAGLWQRLTGFKGLLGDGSGV